MFTFFFNTHCFDWYTCTLSYLFSPEAVSLFLILPCLFFCLTFTLSVQNQVYYSLLHPVMYLLILSFLTNYYYPTLTTLCLFLMLGAIWAYFYNSIFWSFDVVETVTVFLIIITLVRYHTCSHVITFTNLVLFFLTMFKFQLIDSFHSFSRNNIELTDRCPFTQTGVFYTLLIFYIKRQVPRSIESPSVLKCALTFRKYHI